MPAAISLGFIVVVMTCLFLLHILRIRKFSSPFVMLISFLWFVNFFTNNLGYKTPILGMDIRFSLFGYTLIFAAIIIVYICEGIKETQNMILLSIGSQLAIIFGMFFFYHSSQFLIKDPELLQISRRIFKPDAWAIYIVSLVAAIAALYFTIFCFQFLVNKLKRVPKFILIFISVTLAMVLDTIIYLSIVFPKNFFSSFPTEIAIKTFIAALVSIPLGLYLLWFQKKGNLDLKRGSLDIFKKIEDLQVDLEKANEELREYADTLEQKVVARTAEIQEKNKIMALEMKMAADVQQAMLPEDEKHPEIEHSIMYKPCSDVSGDIYDYGTLPDGTIYYFLADISGHGVPSALIGAMCRMSFQEAIHTIQDPASILKHMAEELQQVIGSHFLTSVLVFLKPKERFLIYANGGHNPPLILTNNQQFALLEPTGMIIGQGIVDDYKQKKIRYPAGSRLLMYTDCLTEHKNAEREEYGIERLKEQMAATFQDSPDQTINNLHDNLDEFGNNEDFSDDLTMLLIDLP